MNHGAVLSGGADVDVEHLPEDVVQPRGAPSRAGEVLRPLADVEREHILRVLESCGGHQEDAARILGIGRTTLWRKLRAFGVDGA